MQPARGVASSPRCSLGPSNHQAHAGCLWSFIPVPAISMLEIIQKRLANTWQFFTKGPRPMPTETQPQSDRAAQTPIECVADGESFLIRIPAPNSWRSKKKTSTVLANSRGWRETTLIVNGKPAVLNLSLILGD